MEQIMSYIGTIVGILGLGYAIYQNRERSKLNNYVKANNWFNLQRTNNGNGTIQLAKKLYLQKHSDKLDSEVLNLLAMADAHGQEVYKEVIRQIQISEDSFENKDFERWQKEGKLSDAHLILFKQFSTNANIK